MAKRENGFGPVKSWFETPAQRMEREQRLQERSAPLIKKWERTMTKDEYLQAVREGRSRADIVLKHFNNDQREFKKQLKEWKITEAEAVEVVQGTQTGITVTKEEYLHRRLNGEKRSAVLHSLGLAGPKGYELLKEWGIREMDAEERELAILSPSRTASEVDKRISEQIEQNAEARGLIGDDILKRMEQRAAAQEQELAELQAATALWKNEAERKDEYIKDLEGELTKARAETELGHERFMSVSEEMADEIARLKDALSGAAVISDHAGARIQELEVERGLLLQTIEQAASEESGIIALRIPILSVAIANVERARIYAAVEALSNDVEAAEIDRERVMTELFDLLQRAVNFITADLAELHPGKDVSGFVLEFFNHYNEQHLAILSGIRKAG
jgi:Chromosome segregation ATPases